MLLITLPLGATQPAPEIVIELTGTPAKQTAGTDLDIWNKDSAQLVKLLRGKTREEVLYQATTVSSKDKILRAPDGLRYAFVQYGGPGHYRKFLFQAKDPQTFIAAATNVQEAIALSERYQVNIGITQKEFLATYQKKPGFSTHTLSNGQILYQYPADKKTYAFLFENGQLVRIVPPGEIAKLLQPAPTPSQRPAPAEEPLSTAPYTALLEGGTITDQMYMPRVINPRPVPTPTPSNIPAGTPLWTQNVHP